MSNFCLCVVELFTSKEGMAETLHCTSQSEQALLVCVQTIGGTALGAL
jgi:hypothetical protein